MLTEHERMLFAHAGPRLLAAAARVLTRLDPAAAAAAAPPRPTAAAAAAPPRPAVAAAAARLGGGSAPSEEVHCATPRPGRRLKLDGSSPMLAARIGVRLDGFSAKELAGGACFDSWSSDRWGYDRE